MVHQYDSRRCSLCREESDARVIINAADVKLRSFNTKVNLLCHTYKQSSTRALITNALMCLLERLPGRGLQL